MKLNSEMSMFMYDTRPFWTRYFLLALLHLISLESQDVLSGNYDIKVGGFKVLLKFGKNRSVPLLTVIKFWNWAVMVKSS
jgi:hypothetical protein